MVFDGVVYDHCNVKVIVKSIAAETCNLIFLVETNRNPFEIVHWEVHVVLVSQTNC